MSYNPIFTRYIQIADFLGSFFKNSLEVVVHDFRDLDHSVIHVVNGQISGRKVGDGASELGIRRLLAEESIPDVLVNYENLTERGQKCKSGSMAIRDDDGNMIGALCVNFDLVPFVKFKQFLDLFTLTEINPLVGQEDIRKPSLSNEEEIEQEIQAYLLQKGLSFSQLTYKDKQCIVAHLQKQGCLKKRGAISAIAQSLKLTRQCIYNYLELS